MGVKIGGKKGKSIEFTSWTASANSSIVNSPGGIKGKIKLFFLLGERKRREEGFRAKPGFPKLIGPVWDPSISLIRPSTWRESRGNLGES